MMRSLRGTHRALLIASIAMLSGAKCGTPDDSDFGECDLTLPPGHLPCDIAKAQASMEDLEWQDCYERRSWSYLCADDAQALELAQDGLVWAGRVESDFFWDLAPFTITDAASWQALLDAWWFVDGAASVDFATNVVVVAQDYVSSTCAMSTVGHGMRYEGTPPAPPRLYLLTHDTTGACRQVCDMSSSYAVMYAIPRSTGYPVVCVERFATCDVD